MEPGNIILFGASIVILGSAITAYGGWRQQTEQIAFEKTTNSQLEDAIKSTTGGDSFCYVSVQTGSGLVFNPTLSCQGKYPMYDVSARVYDPDAFANLKPSLSMEEFLKMDLFHLDGGNIPASQAKPFHLTQKLDMQGKDKKILRVEISARNGFFHEDFLIKKFDDRWFRALRLYKGFTNDIIHEWAEPDFPRDAQGKMLWD